MRVVFSLLISPSPKNTLSNPLRFEFFLLLFFFFFFFLFLSFFLFLLSSVYILPPLPSFSLSPPPFFFSPLLTPPPPPPLPPKKIDLVRHPSLPPQHQPRVWPILRRGVACSLEPPIDHSKCFGDFEKFVE